jgi:hypothetical protein
MYLDSFDKDNRTNCDTNENVWRDDNGNKKTICKTNISMKDGGI